MERKLKEGMLKFSVVREIQFHFYQVPNWIFVVREFERQGKNSGWLIDKLIRVNNNQKEEIRDRLLQRKI